jgi:hypothetical protein
MPATAKLIAPALTALCLVLTLTHAAHAGISVNGTNARLLSAQGIAKADPSTENLVGQNAPRTGQLSNGVTLKFRSLNPPKTETH